jgi:hypothetical protein
MIVRGSVAELHNFYAALAQTPGKIFDAALALRLWRSGSGAPVLAPTLQYGKANFLKLSKHMLKLSCL